MQVQELMTKHPACCSPDTELRLVAKMMVDSDCGEIPVVDERHKPVGVVTDRDITVRMVAQGKDARIAIARDAMSNPVVTVDPTTPIEEALRLMEEKQIRRLPVVDENDACCGMIAQADIALRAPEEKTAELVRDVSKPAKR